MAGRLPARLDPASLFFSGGRRAAVFRREPNRQRRHLLDNARPCASARTCPDLPWNLSSLAVLNTNLLHVRGHAHPDRIGLRFSLPAGIHAGANASDRLSAHPHLLLAGIRAVSGAGADLRLPTGRGAAELVSQLHGISLALEQEFESLVGLRSLVS